MFGQQYRKAHADIPAKEMFKRIGEEWGKLNEKEQEEWKAKAEAQNEEYKASYVKENGALPTKAKARKRAKTTNAFQQYVSFFRTKNPSVNHKEVFKMASDEWKKMTPKNKKKYEDQAEALKAEYKTEWEKFKEEHPESVVPTAAALKKSKKEKREQVPRPKTKTGYILWGDNWRAKLNTKGLKGKDAMTAIGESWKNLAKKEREKYENQASKANESVISQFVKEQPDAKWTVNYNKRKGGATATA
jgi:hypothetical protein